MSSMHKEADPKRWEAYAKELKATEDRMRELGAGYGIDFSTFLASPMEGLQEYHGL